MLYFHKLRIQNTARLARWHSGATSEWMGSDWSNAMCGEAGEAANIVKKLRRHETGLGDSTNTPPVKELEKRLAKEVGDIIIYADLLAHYYGLSTEACVTEAFNQKSIDEGFPERLP